MLTVRWSNPFPTLNVVLCRRRSCTRPSRLRQLSPQARLPGTWSATLLIICPEMPPLKRGICPSATSGVGKNHFKSTLVSLFYL